MSAIKDNNSVNTTGDRSFGVEIEFFGITREMAEMALQSVSLPVVIAGRRDANVNEWKITTDGSVSSTNTGCGSGLELVSPILTGKKGYKELKVAIDALKSAGARVNVTCGIHVHLDMRSESNKMIAEFAGIYFGIQTQLEWLVSKSRRGGRNNYCSPMRRSSLSQIQDTLFVGDTRSEFNLSRYNHFNIMSILKHGTVELRMMNGSVNSKKVTAWVQLQQALANWAKSNMELDSAVLSNVDELGQLTIEQVLDKAVQFGLPTATRSFLLKRAHANMRASGYRFNSIAA
jgi:hypothetical protein